MEQAKLLSDTVLAIFRANGCLIAWGDHFAAAQALTSARWQMLGALALAGEPLTAPQIADSMGVSRQGAQKQLNLLFSDGLLTRTPNPAHQRSPLYWLSAAGQRCFSEVDSRWRQHALKVAASFAPGELESVQRLLDKLASLHPPEDAKGENDAR